MTSCHVIHILIANDIKSCREDHIYVFIEVLFMLKMWLSSKLRVSDFFTVLFSLLDLYCQPKIQIQIL